MSTPFNEVRHYGQWIVLLVVYCRTSMWFGRVTQNAKILPKFFSLNGNKKMCMVRHRYLHLTLPSNLLRADSGFAPILCLMILFSALGAHIRCKARVQDLTACEQSLDTYNRSHSVQESQSHESPRQYYQVSDRRL